MINWILCTRTSTLRLQPGTDWALIVTSASGANEDLLWGPGGLAVMFPLGSELTGNGTGLRRLMLSAGRDGFRRIRGVEQVVASSDGGREGYEEGHDSKVR